MSKKKINSRLEHIFDDVSKEATVAPKQVRKIAGDGYSFAVKNPVCPAHSQPA